MQFTDLLDAYLDAKAASDAFLQDPRKSRNELYTARELWLESKEYQDWQTAKKALNEAFEEVRSSFLRGN